MPLPFVITLYCSPEGSVTTPSLALFALRKALPAALVAAAKGRTAAMSEAPRMTLPKWTIFSAEMALFFRSKAYRAPLYMWGTV